MKKPILIVLFLFISLIGSAQVVSIRPDSSGLVQTLRTTITLASGVMMNASPPYNLQDIYLQQGASQVFPDNYDIPTNYYPGTDSLWVNFTFPLNATTGFYDVHVRTYGFIPSPPYYGPIDNVLTNGFRLKNCQAPSAVITSTGPLTYCSGTPGPTLNAPVVAGYTYQWLRNGNVINNATLSSYSPSVIGAYTCRIQNSCSAVISNSISINIINTPISALGSIGPPSLCSSGGTVTLQVSYSSTYTYQWQFSGTNIPLATSNTYIASAIGHYSCIVTNSCASLVSSIDITSVSSLPSAVISVSNGPVICSGGTAYLSVPMVTGTNYLWRKNGIAATGTNYLSGYSATSAGSYDCVVSNGCGTVTSSAVTITVMTQRPVAHITALGPTNTCVGIVLMLSADTAFGNTYEWRRDNFPFSTAPSSIQAVASGIYQCRVSNVCGSNLSNTINVTVNQQPSALISPAGPFNLCSGSTIQMSVPYNSTYAFQWRRNNAPIAGATSNVYVANTTGVFTCDMTNACGTYSTNNGVVINSGDPVPIIYIGSPAAICLGGSARLDAATTSVVQTYQWKRDGTVVGVTTPSITTSTAGLYTCDMTTSCATSTSNSLQVTVNTVPNAVISAAGSTSLCNGGSVTLTAQTSTNWIHQWYKDGTIISGAIWPNYTASSAGSYTCYVTNTCGTSVSNPVIVTNGTAPGIPAAISGQSAGVCNSVKTYSVAAVAGATSYTWTIPSGATLNSGQGTNSVSVTFTSTFSSGNISIVASNACGSSGSRTINITGSPSSPTSITGPASVCRRDRVTYSVTAIAGATTYTWTVPRQASIMSGQGTNTIVVKWGTTAGPVTVRAGNSCGSSNTASLSVSIPCREINPIEIASPVIYPNPSSSSFTLKLPEEFDQPAIFNLHDLTGRRIQTEELKEGVLEFTFGDALEAGIYFAQIISGNEKITIRIVRQH